MYTLRVSINIPIPVSVNIPRRAQSMCIIFNDMIILKIINRKRTWIHDGFGGFEIFNCLFCDGERADEQRKSPDREIISRELSAVTKQMLKIAHANRARSFRARPE